ncbi:hypothetical protein [Methylobacterium soli]|uniref:Uncharacterized protein n=1 Tax=Methylobacterium soli TaxID=553447 RepID=A0A6L3SVH9_9HYPH|nr:hypothetical protein [Methylobacterium soli]KAB1075402.1 hypothetical protein F6X53_24855 [Methylobacterium soli]GJE41295.1 hypothetical protein AEGHOMDF_0457 [Methylobacterium soli]
MASTATIETLLQQGALTEEEVQAAVNAWLATPSATRIPVGPYELIVGTLLRQNGFLAKTMRDPDASEGLKKAALRKVLLQGRPEKR